MPTDHQPHLHAAHGHPEHTPVPAHHEPTHAHEPAHPHGAARARQNHTEHKGAHTGPESHTALHEAHHTPPGGPTAEHQAQHAAAPHGATHAATGRETGRHSTPLGGHAEVLTYAPAAEHIHVARVSHFNDPIPRDGKPHGYSRLAGDAPAEVKQYVVNTLISECQKHGLGREDTAHVLAIARLESGFNPDAAAPSSSACGVGQFIHATGEQYGLTGKNRFDVHDNTKAMVEHYVENKELAQAHGKGEAYIYKYYHDGPHQNNGGLELAHKEVVPYIQTYANALGNMSKGMHHAADSMKVFLADSGQHARDFFHGISDQAHHLAASHHVEGVARAESPFQRDHLERVAFPQGARPSDGLGLMADRTTALAGALADTMRMHGYDSHSVGQSGELAQALMAGVGARKPGQDVLIIHKDGDVLASLASQQDMKSLVKPGDTVLDLRSLDHVALLGFDTAQLSVARGTLAAQASGMSNLELAQMASTSLSAGPRDLGRGMEMT
jgi:hypothetical protein